MKRFFFVFTFIFIVFASFKTTANTGYKQFKEINFKEEGELLVNVSNSEFKKAYKIISKRRLIGWRVHYFNILNEATFIGKDIFGRSNRTNAPLEIFYHLKEVEYAERSHSATGSITTKTKGKIKKFDLNLDSVIKAEIGEKKSTTTTEELKVNLVVMPNTILKLRTTGEVLVSNGVSVYYFLGIAIRKGAWETIDIDTIYYELVEENL